MQVMHQLLTRPLRSLMFRLKCQQMMLKLRQWPRLKLKQKLRRRRRLRHRLRSRHKCKDNKWQMPDKLLKKLLLPRLKYRKLNS